MKNHRRVLIIPRYQAVLRFIELPSMDASEIEAMAGLQALKELPLQKEEIITSFMRMSSDKDGFSNVMLAVIKKELAEDIVLKEKTAPDSIRLETELLYLWIIKKGFVKQDGTSFIIDIQEYYSEIMVIDKARIVFSRGFINRNALLEEINRSVVYYKRNRGYKDIERVVVMCGLRPDMENLKLRIRSFFSSPVDFYERGEYLNGSGSSPEIDLLPKKYIVKRIRKENIKQAFLTYILLFITIAMLASFFIFKTHR